nr:MAG TPA: hypothetical protein [Caudoviricetes sp.]DAT82847.1 MAG TPA: hypothetical protein [Caudoviricetes sp.]DAV90715.1 MAG TPA: hypothetical protein [Caudoviricetes sp.]
MIRVRNSAGDIQWIPEHWLDHPELKKGFTREDAPAEPTSGQTPAAPAPTPWSEQEKEG